MAEPTIPLPPALLTPAPAGRGPGSATRGRVADLLPLGLVRIEALYEIALVGGAGITWRTRGRTLSLERFAAFLWEAGDCAFGVVDRPSGRLVGFVGLYGMDTVSEVASLSAFFDRARPGPRCWPAMRWRRSAAIPSRSSACAS